MPCRPRLLDLFCGAGGAAMGYHRAGFDVIGVDIDPQPNYPFEFVRDDALAYLADLGRPAWDGSIAPRFDAIHASPPCQAYSDTGTSRRRHDHPDLVGPVRDALYATGLPYVIENIPGASMRSAFVLCGSTFGLPIIRHRLFETNPWMIVPKACSTIASTKVTGHPGGPYYPYARGSWEAAWREHVLPVVWPWMTLKEAGQAIPPAYTEHIGGQLLEHIGACHASA